MTSQSAAKKKNIPKSINEMSKETLQETLKKKRECNAKALQTVEKLCEVNVDEKWFLDNLQFINQSHFEDAAVERAISKLCGYPLCKEALEKIPKQQYHISTRYNKVFDISERKNFCSSSCYKAAIFVKNQLFTSPLWFRDQEVIPKYSVLKSEKSSMGEEVVFFPDKIQVEKVEKKPKQKIDVTELEEKYLKLTVNDLIEKDKQKEETKAEVKNNFESKNDEKQVEEIKLEKQEVIEKNRNFVELSKTQDNAAELRKTEKSKTKAKHKTEPVDSISKIEKCVFEWFTLDSLFYLYKEEKIKELFKEDSSRLKEALSSKLKMAMSGDKIDRMIKLYGLLEGTSMNSGSKMNLRPLPDYSALKEEGKMLEIKVKAFYHGQLEVKPENKKPEEKEEKKEEEPEPEKDVIYLPLVDAHSQLALRRKILLEKLNKVLPELINIFSTEYNMQMGDVRNLIATFSLSAHNITFKPNEWYLVGLILIKLLSLKDRHLESLLQLESSQNQLPSLLMTYNLKEDYLENLINRLTDSNNVMERLNDVNK